MSFTPAALPPSGVTANLEHPDRTAQTWDYITQTLCMVFMTVFFALRMYVRLNILNGLGLEDCELVLLQHPLLPLIYQCLWGICASSMTIRKKHFIDTLCQGLAWVHMYGYTFSTTKRNEVNTHGYKISSLEWGIPSLL